MFALANGYAVGQSLHANRKLTSPWETQRSPDISQITRNVSHQPVHPNNALNKILIKIYSLGLCVRVFLASATKHRRAIRTLDGVGRAASHSSDV